MRRAALVGIVLTLLGLAALVFGRIRDTDTEPIVKASLRQRDKKEIPVVSTPSLGGVILLAAGLGLVFVWRSRP